MAILTDVSAFPDIYQLETADDVLGGAGGLANEQAQSLANRTRYLRNMYAPAGVDAGFPGDNTISTGYADSHMTFNGIDGTLTIDDVSTFPVGSFLSIKHKGYGYLDIDAGSGSYIDEWEATGLVHFMQVYRMYPGEEIMLINKGIGGGHHWSIQHWTGRMPAGQIIMISDAAGGFLSHPLPNVVPCDGSLYSRTDYKYRNLFRAIGIQFDHTPGSTVFRVPNIPLALVDGGPETVNYLYAITL